MPRIFLDVDFLHDIELDRTQVSKAIFFSQLSSALLDLFEEVVFDVVKA
jgi:hypothetical protein